MRVLIVAPHAGDERPAQLSAAGAELWVLTLCATDTGDSLGLPEGQLAERLDEIAAGLRSRLLDWAPDLLFVPEPGGTKEDTRAAFAAVHRLLSGIREHGESDVLLGLKVQLYTLDSPEPLTVEDFATRSLSQLVRALGGSPELAEVREGPRVSVVVRTRDRPQLLAEALASLAGGHYRRVEVVLVNDGGASPQLPADYPFPIIRVDWSESRGRAAAAEAGVNAATGEWIAFLDDDDLAAPEHLAVLAGLTAAAGLRVVYTDAAVAVYELDPEEGWSCRERRIPYSRDFDPDVLAVDNYIPFNTLLIERRLFAEAGPFDSSLPFFEDWDYLLRLAAITPFHHLARVTCEYRHFRGGGHHIFGERPRERADFLAVKARVIAKHSVHRSPEVLARAVDTLRAEAVQEREGRLQAQRDLEASSATLHRELDELRRAHQGLSTERFLFEDRYHAANGQIEALRGVQHQLEVEIQRLYGQEQQLRDVVADQTAHLGRTYAEIERLNQLIREMESTRAWRLHRWWHR
jgi:hypothetical protein